jgi:hypothetical protein
MVATEPTPKDKGRDRPSHPDPGRRGHIGWIVAGSLATGLVAAFLLVGAPFIPAEEPASLAPSCAGSRWAGRCWRCSRFGSPISRSGGLWLLHCSWDWAACCWWGLVSRCTRVLDWVWPPAMLVLAVWMFVCVHRQLRSRGGRWLLYPVIELLALASIGGGYQTLGEAADAEAYPMPG